MTESEKPRRRRLTEAEIEANCREILEWQPTPKAKPEPPAADVIPFNPWPVKRKWTAGPLATVNSVPYQPTDAELLQTKLAVDRAALASRRSRDPVGAGHWGHEMTIEDVVRRQNGDD